MSIEPHKGEKYRPLEYLTLNIYGNSEVLELFRSELPKDGRRLAILALGGGQAGVISAGICIGMYDSGVFQRADGLFGVSAGIANLVYVETGQGHLGASLYFELNTQGDVIKPPHSFLDKIRLAAKAFSSIPVSPILDIPLIGRHMREDLPFDAKTFKSSSKEILALVSHAEDGRCEFLDVKVAEDPIVPIEAAICVPGISNVPWVEVNGQPYFDAGFLNPVPLEAVFEKGYTDVLIVGSFDLSRHRGFLASLQQRVIAKLGNSGSYGYSREVIEAIGRYHANLHKAHLDVWKVIQEKDPQRRVTVISPLNNGFQMINIGNMDMDSGKIKRAFEDAYYYGVLHF